VRDHELELVRFVLFGDETYDAFKKVSDTFFAGV
jgi:hypothetical protein